MENNDYLKLRELYHFNMFHDPKTGRFTNDMAGDAYPQNLPTLATVKKSTYDDNKYLTVKDKESFESNIATLAEAYNLPSKDVRDVVDEARRNYNDFYDFTKDDSDDSDVKDDGPIDADFTSKVPPSLPSVVDTTTKSEEKATSKEPGKTKADVESESSAKAFGAILSSLPGALDSLGKSIPNEQGKGSKKYGSYKKMSDEEIKLAIRRLQSEHTYSDLVGDTKYQKTKAETAKNIVSGLSLLSTAAISVRALFGAIKAAKD